MVRAKIERRSGVINKKFIENKEARKLMKFFLLECQKLEKKRKKGWDDEDNELGTYNQGYYKALLDISTKMIIKTKLN